MHFSDPQQEPLRHFDQILEHNTAAHMEDKKDKMWLSEKGWTGSLNWGCPGVSWLSYKTYGKLLLKKCDEKWSPILIRKVFPKDAWAIHYVADFSQLELGRCGLSKHELWGIGSMAAGPCLLSAGMYDIPTAECTYGIFTLRLAAISWQEDWFSAQHFGKSQAK